MEAYNFLVYHESGFISQITNTNCPDLPKIPAEHPFKAIHVDFYNSNIVGCFYANGKFYEDETLTSLIIEPSTYRP